MAMQLQPKPDTRCAHCGQPIHQGYDYVLEAWVWNHDVPRATCFYPSPPEEPIYNDLDELLEDIAVGLLVVGFFLLPWYFILRGLGVLP